MSKTEVFEKINTVFRTIFADDSLVVTQETTAADIEDWDSLEQINILVAMEKTFGIKFTVGEVEGLKNVGEMADLVISKIA